MLLVSAFVLFYFLLKEAVKRENLKMNNLFELSKNERKILKARADSIFYLKIIVTTFWLSTAYNFLYSIIVRLITQSDCTPYDKLEFLVAFLKLLDRLDAFVIWMWPLLYLFWPSKFNTVAQKRIDNQVNEISERSSSDSESVTNFRTSELLRFTSSSQH